MVVRSQANGRTNLKGKIEALSAVISAALGYAGRPFEVEMAKVGFSLVDARATK